MISQGNNNLARCAVMWMLVLISLLFLSADSFAESGVSLKLETASAEPGSKVQIPITIENNVGLSSIKLLIKYDSTALTLTDVTVPKEIDMYSSVPQPYDANQIINFVSPLAAFTKTGTIAVLTFSVNSNAKLNETSNITIEHEDDDIFDMSFNKVPLVSVNGAIYVSDGSQESLAELPSALTVIEDESFMNTSFYYVVLPETTTEIGAKAFANCSNLKYIYIPENTSKIAENAFLNVTNLTIYGKDGSYAEFFANKKGYTFQVR